MVFLELECITPGSSGLQISFEKSAVILMGFPLYVTSDFVFIFFAAFNILSLYFILSV